MAWLIKIKEWVLTPLTRYRARKAQEARIAELRKRDPFIYK